MYEFTPSSIKTWFNVLEVYALVKPSGLWFFDHRWQSGIVIKENNLRVSVLCACDDGEARIQICVPTGITRMIWD